MLKIKISRGILIYQIQFKIKPSKNLEIWWYYYYYVFYFFIIKFLRGINELVKALKFGIIVIMYFIINFLKGR